MSSFEELDAAVAFLKLKKLPYSILQCTTAYPTNEKQIGLNVIQQLKERYKVTVGFSDHSANVNTGIAAVSLGAKILEFHVILNSDEIGPDVSSSLTIDEVKNLVTGAHYIYNTLKYPITKRDTSAFVELKQIFEKSLAVNKALPKGHRLVFSDLEAKKPKGYGINAFEFETVLGKKITRDLDCWEFLNKKDVI